MKSAYSCNGTASIEQKGKNLHLFINGICTESLDNISQNLIMAKVHVEIGLFSCYRNWGVCQEGKLLTFEKHRFTTTYQGTSEWDLLHQIQSKINATGFKFKTWLLISLWSFYFSCAFRLTNFTTNFDDTLGNRRNLFTNKVTLYKYELSSLLLLILLLLVKKTQIAA